MCLIFIAHRAHPDYPLIVAANRDEFHARPTASAAVWPGERQPLFAGRDLEAGGTWMGVTGDGRFAALTNYRGPAATELNPSSRGGLVTGFLTGMASAEEYIAALEPDGHRYNGFSVLVHDGDSLYCYSNRAGQVTQVAAGVHGLSNHLLDSPWPKVTRGTAAIERYLEHTDDVPSLVEPLFDLLSDRAQPADLELPDTGVGLARERELAPMFVHGELYGTRSSTVVLIDRDGRITAEERSFDARAIDILRVTHTWDLPVRSTAAAD